ncbi:hypothetical protein Cgig2_019687 [Carnegiea gigantea]|uniref:Uncharacterized protein n=1 Tax=Carnegiea gigantea TaxID=171969 RepID=A0A9Q1K1N3_9CARY|nr:hypothetical protein Cgig2_019687 [Carnegiea gigantea]
MSSGSEYAPSEMGSSTEDTVSMMDESCEAVGGSSSEDNDAEEVHADSDEGSGKGKSQKRRRESIVKGRRWRHKAAGDGFMFGKKGMDLRGTVPVLRRKAFIRTGSLVPFSVYDITLFICLPVTSKVVEFGEDNLSTTKLAMMVRLRMAQYVTEKSDNPKSEKGRQRPVFRNYINVIKKLLEANKEPEKMIPMLRPQEEEILEPTVRAFMKTDGFRDYILDGEIVGWSSIQGVLSYEEHLEQAREKLRAEKGKHELKARLKRCTAPAAPQDTRHQPGDDVEVDVQSRLDSMEGAVTNAGEATVHEINPVKGTNEDATCQTTVDIPRATYDDQSKRMAETAAPVDGCDDVGDAPSVVSRMYSPLLKLKTFAKERMMQRRCHTGKMM